MRVFKAEEHIMHKKILAAGIIAFGALSASTAFAQNMKLTSGEVAEGSTIKDAQVANTFGCKGGNASPSLSWSGAPSDTKSFAITVYDPDAPTGSGFWHWVLFDIPGDVTELPSGAGSGDMVGLPAGAVHARNDYGTRDFGGAAPPPGDPLHRYVFAVHAVDAEKLGADGDASPAFVGFNLTFHVMARGLMVATFSR
jgi:Raf kinase inhibitor-like YbhB/YbcL family protein